MNGCSTPKGTTAPAKPPAAAEQPTATAAEGDSTVEAKDMLTLILETAQDGRVLDCPLKAGESTLEDGNKLWGEADNRNWVSDAKGMYSTYSKQGIVLGSNKGDAIFEVRTYDSNLKRITRAEAESVLGAPAQTAQAGEDAVLGFVVNPSYRLLLVFKAQADGGKAVLDHYSVLYPKGTVNNMADDSGREW